MSYFSFPCIIFNTVALTIVILEKKITIKFSSLKLGKKRQICFIYFKLSIHMKPIPTHYILIFFSPNNFGLKLTSSIAPFNSFTNIDTNLPISSQMGVVPSSWRRRLAFRMFFALSTSWSVIFVHNAILQEVMHKVINNFFSLL